MTTIEPDSPAIKAGLLPGDLLTSIGGESLASVEDLQRLLATRRIREDTTLKLLRENKPMELAVTLGERVSA